MKRVLITGGSGFLGRTLTEQLIAADYEVRWLSRSLDIHKPTGVKVYLWDVNKGYLDRKALEDVNVVVHLSGAGIADKRWTMKYKQELIRSRTFTAAMLALCLKEMNIKLDVFIGGSAVGYYGREKTDKIFTEDDKEGDDFLAKVCYVWEKTYDLIKEMNTRTCIVRTGLVLSEKGGFYKKVAPIFKYGLGVILGDGKQYMPWISVDDWCGIVKFLIEKQKCEGVFNAVQGSYITHEEFSKLLAESFNKKLLPIKIPEWFLKILLGEASEIITRGVKVSSEIIRQCGYEFQHNDLVQLFQQLKLKYERES